MKTYREKKAENALKANKKIWKSLSIERAVKSYGLSSVKTAISKWLEYQRKNTKLLKEKALLESKLAEINNKI